MCIYYIVEREGKANLIRHTTDRRGEERESSWWRERERGDLLLFYDGYGDGSSWRRNETVVQVNCSYCKVHGPVK